VSICGQAKKNKLNFVIVEHFHICLEEMEKRVGFVEADTVEVFVEVPASSQLECDRI